MDLLPTDGGQISAILFFYNFNTRYGGDEFVIMFNGTSKHESIPL